MKLLTNFPNYDFELYEYCVNTFPKSKEYGLYLRTDAYYGVNNNILYEDHCSLWTSIPGYDKSDFWIYLENVDKNWKIKRYRELKLNRIIDEE